MFEGTNSTKYSENAVRESHEQYRKDLQYEMELSWKYMMKGLKVIGVIFALITVLVALD